jgi:hypothetical protein
MTAPKTTPWYGGPTEWANIISGAGQGAGSAFQGSSQLANSKEESKETKRRTLANLMNQAMKRNRGLFRVGQDYQDEMSDFQTNALQQVARGFVEALQGSTGRS